MRVRLASTVVLMLVALVALTGCGGDEGKGAKADGSVPVRLGWQVGDPYSGTLTATLTNTDIAKRHSLDLRPTVFLYGPPSVEALVAGDVDIALLGSVPLIGLLAKNAPVTQIAWVGQPRQGLLVKNDSPIHSIADLKGKSIAVPFGSAVQAQLYEWLQAAGLDPKNDVKLVNLAPTDQQAALASGDVDAIAVWDAFVASYEVNKTARNLLTPQYAATPKPYVHPANKGDDVYNLAAWVVRNDFLKAHPDVVDRFLDSVVEGQVYMAKHLDQAIRWYNLSSQLGEPVIKHALSFDWETRIKSASDLSAWNFDDNLAHWKDAGDFMVDFGSIKSVPDIAAAVDNDRYKAAVARAGKG